MSKFSEEILNKIDNKQYLTERELEKIIRRYTIEEKEGDSNRWTRDMENILLIGDRYFSIFWRAGATESQQDEFGYQPEEVKPVEYIQTRKVKEWIDINADEQKYIEKHERMI